jgi:hypothetical protein
MNTFGVSGVKGGFVEALLSYEVNQHMVAMDARMTDIITYAKAMVQQAAKLNDTIYGEYNGVRLVCESHTSLYSLCMHYSKAKRYSASDEMKLIRELSNEG